MAVRSHPPSGVVPAHRRRDVTVGFDARQKIIEVGLQVRLIVRRHHAVHAGRAILARQAIGFEHPLTVDQVVQRGQHPLGVFSRQIGYPLSFRGQVRGTQSSLPCFSSMGLNAWRLPSLQRVPVSPAPRHPQYYKAATTSRRASPSVYVFASGFHMPLRFVFACALPCSPSERSGPEHCLGRCSCPADSYGHKRDLSGFWPIPYLCPAQRPRRNR